MKKTIILVTLLSMTLCACGVNEEMEGSGTDHSAIVETGSYVEESKEPYSSEMVWETVVRDDMWMKDIGEIYELEEEIAVETELTSLTQTIHNVQITKKFEQDMAEWSAPGLMGVQAGDGEITNEYSLVYISGTVTNDSNETCSYGLSSVGLMLEKDEMVLQAAYELGYSNLMGSGKGAMIVELAPQESVDYVLGYAIKDNVLNYPLYVEVSGISASQNYKLVPFEVE